MEDRSPVFPKVKNSYANYSIHALKELWLTLLLFAK